MTPPVSPCGPLCASVAGEAESLLFPAGLRQREPVMGGIATQGFRPFWSGTEGRKEKQEKALALLCVRTVTTARGAGGFGDLKLALFRPVGFEIGAVLVKNRLNPRRCGISGGADEKRRRFWR